MPKIHTNINAHTLALTQTHTRIQKDPAKFKKLCEVHTSYLIYPKHITVTVQRRL